MDPVHFGIMLVLNLSIALITRRSPLPRFPELAHAQFSHGKMPHFESVRRYLLAEHEAGTVRVEDVDLAATQFLGMISNYVFWPALLVPGWEVSGERVADVVDEAVRTMVARYAATGR
jgi:TetR/AcrR family transcriptional regulator of autoinduction and epiphytic fitness